MDYQGKEMRHEIKYSINDLEYSYLKARLKAIMAPDKNSNEDGEYHIRSLYFDDINNTSYHQKESGEFQRAKYRIRIYNYSDNIISLEKKEKFNQFISKTSRKIGKDLYYKILHNQLNIQEYKDDEFLLEFFIKMRIHKLSPVVIVDYIREPYVYKNGNVRITFDKNLKTAINTFDIFDKSALTVSPNIYGPIVLEVKYDDYLPEFIRKELRMYRHQQLAISKYTICRELRNNLNWSECVI
ncbi:polyphosphate polymerase domain-containing protein [Tissierella sp. Yu-01]|uniref:polyphosphate polymerase domain-containing protein n=1 Tax=Tissierella sp. Yu-01 TaxID=3035694 RepID=UPI00240DDE1C|nr:polyphosphate polymerase domain-containing protein [Tissierella sp. Yu-01]WFA10148.1 polyphosphate polymerase domain-containing protein [Tissierella sp. Yu-01]